MKPQGKLEDIPLTALNAAHQREQAKLDALQADAARVAMEAVAKAFSNAPSVDEVVAASQPTKGKK